MQTAGRQLWLSSRYDNSDPGAPWQLIALVPNSLLTWWVGVGFFRWAADTERRALAKQAT